MKRHHPVDPDLGGLLEKPLQPVTVLGGRHGNMHLVIPLFEIHDRAVDLHHAALVMGIGDGSFVPSTGAVDHHHRVAGPQSQHLHGMSRLGLVELYRVPGNPGRIKKMHWVLYFRQKY